VSLSIVLSPHTSCARDDIKKKCFQMPRCLVQGPLRRVLDSLRFCVIGLDLVNSVYIRKEVDWTTKMKARADESEEMTLQNANCVHFTYLSSEERGVVLFMDSWVI